MRETIAPSKKGEPISARLDRWSRRNQSTGCLEWVGGTRKGYGRLRVGKKDFGAHKLAWMEKKGAIPEGLWVLHKCDNPCCIEITHLFLGTPKDNFIDMQNKGRYLPPRGEKQPHAKLTVDAVLALRRLYGSGKTAKELEAITGVNKMTIIDAVRGRTWAHIPGCIPNKTPFQGRTTRREE